MNVWVQIRVQRVMCYNYNNTINLEQYIYVMYHFCYTMYHSQNSSFNSLFRFKESSWTVEVLVWQYNIKTVQNPTDIDRYRRSLPKWARGLLVMWEVAGSKLVAIGRNVKTNLSRSYHFANFLIKNPKNTRFFPSAFEF